jgi:hypothetical protein
LRSAVLVLALGMLAMGIPGCMENIALIGRPTIEEGQSDVVGEVDRVDLSSRRIYLHSNSGDRRVVPFSADAQVLYRGREYPMGRLKPGDLVAMQMKRDSRGDSYTDLIRIQENSREQSRGDVVSSAPRIQTLAGRVQSVNQRPMRSSSTIGRASSSRCAFQRTCEIPIGIVSELCGLEIM